MADTRTLEDVRKIILAAHKNTGPKDKISFYENWAENYNQVTNATAHTFRCLLLWLLSLLRLILHVL